MYKPRLTSTSFTLQAAAMASRQHHTRNTPGTAMPLPWCLVIPNRCEPPSAAALCPPLCRPLRTARWDGLFGFLPSQRPTCSAPLLLLLAGQPLTLPCEDGGGATACWPPPPRPWHWPSPPPGPACTLRMNGSTCSGACMHASMQCACGRDLRGAGAQQQQQQAG